MQAWKLYNASMEIASRCNQVFSKNFTFVITKYAGLWIDAIPCYNREKAPYYIHMVLCPNNTLEVYFNVATQLEESEWIEDCFEDLEDIAYKLGHNIAKKYAIKKELHSIFL